MILTKLMTFLALSHEADNSHFTNFTNIYVPNFTYLGEQTIDTQWNRVPWNFNIIEWLPLEIESKLETLSNVIDNNFQLIVLVVSNLLAYKVAGLKGFIYSWIIVRIVGTRNILSAGAVLLNLYFNTPRRVIYLLLAIIINYEVYNFTDYLKRAINTLISFCHFIWSVRASFRAH